MTDFRDQNSVLLAHPAAEELLGYLYSFLLFCSGVDVGDLSESVVGDVNAQVQVEIDIWVAGRNEKILRPNHSSSMFRFVKNIRGVKWFVQPTGAKLIGVRFSDKYFGSELVYAEIDFGDDNRLSRPKILSIFRGSEDLDFWIRREESDRFMRIVYVEKKGRRALLFPKSHKLNDWEVMPLDDLSLGGHVADSVRLDMGKRISLEDFIGSD